MKWINKKNLKHQTNTLGKGINLTIPLPAMDK